MSFMHVQNNKRCFNNKILKIFNINDVRSACEAVVSVATAIDGSAERLDTLSKKLTSKIPNFTSF